VTWDRDTIVEMLSMDPRCLSGSEARLLRILGAQRHQLNFALLEGHSRTWIRNECSALSLRDTLEAFVIAQHCRRENRNDLACYTCLMLVRSLWATVHAQNPVPEALETAIAVGRKLFRNYAVEIWHACSSGLRDSDAVVQEDLTPAALVTYPIRCLAIVEILAMLALLGPPNSPESNEVAEYLTAFVAANPGAAHPISDRWGISVACCALVMSRHGKAQAARAYIRSVVKWVADHYDYGNPGLAGPYSRPEEEVAFVLGPPFEHTDLRRRSESYIATQLLDLCSVLEDPELFEEGRNEFLAVDITLPVLEVEDSRAMYCVNSDGQPFECNMPYEEYWRPLGGWKVAPHHKRGPDLYYPESKGGIWDQAAISCVVRDRHFVKSWRRLVEHCQTGDA
jgi:hypothetical protein